MRDVRSSSDAEEFSKKSFADMILSAAISIQQGPAVKFPVPNAQFRCIVTIQ